MNIRLIAAVLETPTEKAIQELLADETTVFWVDWRQGDETIVEDCEAVLRTGVLSSERVEVDTDDGYEVHIVYRGRRHKVPLTYSGRDRHITICSLNDVLRPDFEVRFCIDSNGSDTLAFLPLPATEWAALEGRYGDAVAGRFYRIAARPNLFTDVLPF